MRIFNIALKTFFIPAFLAAAATSQSAPLVLPREPIQPVYTSAPLFKKEVPETARRAARNLDKSSQQIKSWKELAPGIALSKAYAASWPQEERAVEHSGLLITWRDVTRSLNLLESLLPRLDSEPELLAANFTWLRLAPGPRFTSYYSPLVKASLSKTPAFSHPLYRLPDCIAPELAYCLASHSCPEEAFTRVIAPARPYHNRAAIDLDNSLKNEKLEMAFVSHPFDAYLLMLEGSGVLEFPDGQRRAVLFSGLNRQPGGPTSSMAGYLLRNKEITRKNASMNGMRAWWDTASPQKRRNLLEACPTYVFFRFGAPEPKGTAGGPLMPWVSLAADPQIMPLGGIIAFDLPLPGKNIKGLGFAHDTGGAIKMRRLDLYAGTGPEAESRAYTINNRGESWLLLAK